MKSIGLDLHKIHCQVCEIEGDVIAEYRVRTSRHDLIERFGRMPPCRILLEASTESEWVARVLEECGHEVVVADPNFAPMYATRSRRIKNDKRDARALAEACVLGAYRPAHRLSDESRQLRSRVLVRESLVQSRTRLINLSLALLRLQGIRVPTGDSSTFAKRVRSVEMDPALAETIAPLLEHHAFLNEQIKRADQSLEDVAAADLEIQRLCSVPCVGPVTAATFVTTLDDPARFENSRQVRAFLGLVPRESSSGERLHRGPITKVGNRRARVLLIQAAWGIWRSKSAEAAPLRDWAARIALRRGKRRAAVALARRLAGILWAMWRDQVVYNVEEVSQPV